MCTVKCSPLFVCDTLQQNLRVNEPRSICHIWPHGRISLCMATLFIYRQQDFSLCPCSFQCLSQENDALAQNFSPAYWLAGVHASHHISKRICIQASSTVGSCMHHDLAEDICLCCLCVFVCMCICAYGCVRIESPHLCVEAKYQTVVYIRAPWCECASAALGFAGIHGTVA